MKAKDFRQMSDEQLTLSMNELIKNLFHLRIQSATDRLETKTDIKKAKTDVARIRTILRERQMGIRGQKSTVVGS